MSEPRSRSLIPCSSDGDLFNTTATTVPIHTASDNDLGKGYDEDDVNVFFNKILFGNTEDPRLLQLGKGLKKSCEENDLLQVIRNTLHLAVLYHFDKMMDSNKVKGEELEKKKRRQRKNKRRLDDSTKIRGDEDMNEEKSTNAVHVPETGHNIFVPDSCENVIDIVEGEGCNPKDQAVSTLTVFQSSSNGSTKSEDTGNQNQGGLLLWEFLLALLDDPHQQYARYITWLNAGTGVFQIVDPSELAHLWGIQKNHLTMNYDKLSRSLRYYYTVNILRKVQGQKHCYQFVKTSGELKSIKNFPLFQQVSSPPVSAMYEAQQNFRVPSLVNVPKSLPFGGRPRIAPLAFTTRKRCDQNQDQDQPLQLTVKMESSSDFEELEEGPTDLSMVVIR